MRKRIRREKHLDWNIEPWASFAFHRIPGPVDFRVMRAQLKLTQTQCAELLGVYRNTVQSWDTGKKRVPPMAYHLLRLLLESKHFAARHADWQGWQIARDGLLYGPDSCYGFSPADLRAWWYERQAAKTAHQNAANLDAALAAAQRENTELRALFVNQGVVDELVSMQTRLTELVSKLNTARVIQFPQKSTNPKKAAAS